MAADWLSMEHAPRDGTAFRARVPGHGSDFIVAWIGGFVGDNGEDCATWVIIEDQEPPEDWDDGVCWSSNSAGVPSTQPDGWKPLAAAQETPHG